ncbi:uncharacterized protein [Ptychodera flava]|uniref:uncharacterized protein isoform X2 n=1 Tax=Ptychodera flava TaxID=63121 RepID=UPI00396A31D9
MRLTCTALTAPISPIKYVCPSPLCRSGDQTRMPKGHRRRRRRRSRCESRQRSSSSQSSVEITATAKSPHGGPTIIATATAPVNSRSDRESAAVAMATILAKELQPEHKLPSKEITVRPKPAFLELLNSVGAKGHMFTTRQLLSYLIKYIGNRHLYDENDPRKVYCENDPLGKVFGVAGFTIKDVKNLMFANVSVVSDPANLAEHHNPNYQHQVRQSYYTLQHHHQQMVSRKEAGHVTMASCSTAKAASSSTMATPIATAASGSMPAPMPPVVMEAAVSTSSTRSPSNSPDSKVKSLGGAAYISPARKPDCVSKEKEPQSSTESSATVESKMSRKSTDIQSLQGHETAYVADSSDDLWFLEEDDHFSVEYEVESEASEGYQFGNTTSETDSSDASTEVYEVLQLCDDNDSCFADDDSSDTDGELTDQDKWACSECSTWNSPIRRNCIRCWALRKGWLPDSERLSQLKTIRENRQLQRSISAPDAILHQTSSASGSASVRPGSGGLHRPVPIRCGEPISSLETSMRSVAVGGYDEPDIGIPGERGKSSQTGQSLQNSPSRKGKDFPDSSSSGPDGPESCTVDDAVGQREIRLAEDEAGIWPVQGHQAVPVIAPGDLPVAADGIGAPAAGDVPDTDPSDVAGIPLVYAHAGPHDVPDTDPADVASSSGVAAQSSGAFGTSSPQGTKRSLSTALDSPERLPLKKRKTSRDSQSPGTISPGSDRLSPSGRRLDFSSQTDTDVNEYDAERNTSHFQLRRSPHIQTLRKDSSQTTISPQSQGDPFSQHASGSDDKLSPRLRMQREGRSDSGVHMTSHSSLGSEVSTSSRTTGLFHPQPVSAASAASSSSSPLKSFAEKPNPAMASTPSTSRTSPTQQPGPSSSTPKPRDSHSFSDMCMICLTRPKAASIIHGRTGHQVCCYSCAKKLRRHGKPCPVCRRPIQLVIKNYLV